MQVNEKISCEKDAIVHAQYIIQGEELKQGQEVLDFFYLVRFIWWVSGQSGVVSLSQHNQV